MANTYRYPLITWEWMLEEIPTTDPFFPILFCFTLLSIGKNSANNQNNKEILLQSPVTKAGCCNNEWGRAHAGDYSNCTTHQYQRNIFVVWWSRSQTVKLRAGVQIPVEANFFQLFSAVAVYMPSFTSTSMQCICGVVVRASDCEAVGQGSKPQRGKIFISFSQQ